MLPATRPRSRVLLVEEDAIISRLIQRGLVGEVDIVDAGSPAAALALLARGDSFDVVVFDADFDDAIDAAEFYDLLCTERPMLATRSVLMSRKAKGTEDVEFMARFRGHVLAKPFDLEELATAIELAAGTP